MQTVRYRDKRKKYQINYNPSSYNVKTRQYESKEGVYINYGQARANHWKCEKCCVLFATLKGLRIHKAEDHSY